MEKNGRYTIGTLHYIESYGIYKPHITFMYKGKIEERQWDNSYSEYIGKRIFIKFDPNGIAVSVGQDCIVPDSIKFAPDEGWTKEWMQAHCPNCALAEKFSK